MKDALYLELDEDITSAVDKLSKLDGDSVQVVVPKRSTLLQSMINLKLLKKAADDHKKQLVLVTTDRLSTHLAGRVGLAVAAKLGGKPAVPETETKEPDQGAEVIDGGEAETTAVKAEEAMAPEPVAAATGKPSMTKRSLETDEPTGDAEPTDDAANGPTTAKSNDQSAGKTKGKSRGPKVPDFNVLQRRLLWAGLAVVILIVLFVLNVFLTSAKVTVYAKGAAVPLTVDFTASPAAGSTDIPGAVLKAQTVTSTKDLSQQVNATGTQDVGTKASGSMTIDNCYSASSITIPAGTTFTTNGKNFTSNSSVAVDGAKGNFFSGCTQPGTGVVAVTASQNGDQYNVGPASYSVSGYPNSTSNGVVGQGGQMSGGTTKSIAIVAQSDIDGAVASLLNGDKSSGQQGLDGKVPSGDRLVGETFTQGQTNVSSDPAVGAPASTVSVKVTATYSALAISKSDLDSLLKDRTLKQVGLSNQVYDDGAAGAKFTLTKANGDGSQALQVAVTAYAGPKLDTAAIATKIKGQRAGDASATLSGMTGIDHAQITLWPSWATKLPSRTSKIKVTIKVSGAGG